MKTQGFLKSDQYKFLLGLVIVLGVIVIAKAGYGFGQWLHQAIN